MNPLVIKIFDRVHSEDEEVRSYAVTDLSFLLEMYQWNLSKEARRNRYEDLVTEDIIELELDETELQEIVEFLKREIEKGEEDRELSSCMLFAMGKAPSSVGIKPLLEVVQNKLDSFNENELYQALIALERQFPFEDDPNVDEKKRIFSEAKITKRISNKIVSLQPIRHSGLESTALRFLTALGVSNLTG